VAIEENLNKLERNDGDRIVGLVTFNQSVHIIGDGDIEERSICNDYLDDKEKIKEFSENTRELKPIKNSKNKLIEKIQK
jgi:hypothetical protein